MSTASRRACVVSGVLLIALALAACAGSSSPRAGGKYPGALRTVRGYRDYANCRVRCAGSVPAGLRRPLRLPRLRAGASCPITRTHAASVDFYRPLGAGPVYAAITTTRGAVYLPYPPRHEARRAPFAGSKWSAFKVLWVSRPSYDGPVLIRGRRLDGSGTLGFGVETVPWAEMQLSAGDDGAAPLSAHGWRNWPSTTRATSPGCYGWQADGIGFSTTIVLRARALRASRPAVAAREDHR